MKLRHHALHAAKGLTIGVAIMAGIVSASIGLFVAIWGWTRFHADFIPLDNSRVGPNLCASVAVSVLVIAHASYREAVRDVEAGMSIKATIKDLEVEVLHPVAAAEQHIADDVDTNLAEGGSSPV